MSRRIYILFTIIALVLISFIPAGVVSAQSAVKYLGLVIRTPAEYGGFTYEFFMDPGETRCDQFLSQHDYQDEQTSKLFYTMVSDLEFDPETGNPILPRDRLVLDTPYSLAKWITVDRDQVYLPYWGFEQPVNFCVTVPVNASGGSRFAHIFLSNLTVDEYVGEDSIQSNNNAAIIGGRTGVNVLVTVSGNVNTNMSVVGMEVLDPLRKPGFLSIFESIPLYIQTTLRNEGNQVLRPYGNVTIHQGDISQPTLSPFVFNQDGRLLLPDSEVRFENAWDEPTLQSYVVNTSSEGGTDNKWLSLNFDLSQIPDLKLGRYIATAQVAYKDINGDHALANSYSVIFWVIPWRLLLILVIIIAILTGITYYRRKNYVRYVKRSKFRAKLK